MKMVDYVTQRGHSVTFGNYGWYYTYGNPREVTNEEVKEVWEMWFLHDFTRQFIPAA